MDLPIKRHIVVQRTQPDQALNGALFRAAILLVQFFALAAIAFALLGWAVALNPQA